MKKSFGLGLSLLIAAAMLNGCGAAPSGNNSAAASNNKQSAAAGEQQPAENTETIIPNETEDSDKMDADATSKKLVVYFSMPETTEPGNMSRRKNSVPLLLTVRYWETPNMPHM